MSVYLTLKSDVRKLARRVFAPVCVPLFTTRVCCCPKKETTKKALKRQPQPQYFVVVSCSSLFFGFFPHRQEVLTTLLAERLLRGSVKGGEQREQKRFFKRTTKSVRGGPVCRHPLGDKKGANESSNMQREFPHNQRKSRAATVCSVDMNWDEGT